MLLVYTNGTLALGSEGAAPLVADVVGGLREIAHAFYDDEVTCAEKENFAVTALFTKTRVTFLWAGKRFADLRRFHAAYAEAMLYSDFALFEKFVYAN